MFNTIEFKRKFSRNFYKSERMQLSEMKFGLLPLESKRGALYPTVRSFGKFNETLNGSYNFTPKGGAATIARLIGRFNPYSTYDIEVKKFPDGASVGILVRADNELISYAKREGDMLGFYYRLNGEEKRFGEFKSRGVDRILFTYHEGVYVDAYVQLGGVIHPVAYANIPECLTLKKESVFNSADASLYIESELKVTVGEVDNYLDCGIMQADVKPVKYENGDVLIKDGKIFLTYTSRFENEMMQQIASYKLSTAEFKLEGALLFDVGDDLWCGDVATSLMYDRCANVWRLWTCLFSHEHTLAYAEFENEPLYGINVIDVKQVAPTDDIYTFGGISGDEDPDFIYVKEERCWYLTICRSAENKKYRYFLFKSDRPDSGFEYVARYEDESEVTGGRFANYNGKTYFVFGRAFSEMSKYVCCSVPDMKKMGELKCDHPDGGFRGWGTVFEIPCGTRKKLLWVTFDRTLGSSYNWSYGNFYFYESATEKI